MQILLILALAGLMQAARSFLPSPEASGGAAGTALAFGYLLLTAFFAGGLAESIKLPRITGYRVAGMIAGPSVLNLLSADMSSNLRIFNGIAIALIALTAGVELDLREIRPLLRSIVWIDILAILGTAVLLSAAAFFGRDFIPFMKTMSVMQAAAVAVVLGSVMAAQSPAIVVALRTEMRADGPLMRTVLGVVVLSDLVIILLFALSSTVARTFFGAAAAAAETALNLTWELFGSMLVGLAVGVLVAAYLRYVKTANALFIVVIGFVVAEVGQRVDLDPLILALTAGLFVRNTTTLGPLLQHTVESASLPVFVVFFGVTGAGVGLKEFAAVWPVAAAFALIRAGGFFTGSVAASKITNAPANVRRFVATGLIPQSGLALALTLIIAKTFPSFGGAAAALVMAVIAMNEGVGAILFRWALVRSGEAGQDEISFASLERDRHPLGSGELSSAQTVHDSRRA